MQAGVATRDSTPPVGIEMMGFAARDHGAEGIHDALSVRTLWLADDDSRLALVAADVSGLSADEVTLIKERIAQRTGLRPAQILINCTHTHAGPLTAPRMYARGEFDADYREQLRTAIVESVEAAQQSAQPASLSVAMGQCGAGINRRLPTPDGVIMAPNLDAPFNRDALALWVETAAGAPLAVLCSVSCHPTTMGANNYLISAEYPGVTRCLLEAELDGAVAIFMQGAAGEIKPRQTADFAAERFRSGTFADVDAVGQQVAQSVLRMLDGERQPVRGRLWAAADTVSLPFNLPADPDDYYRALAGDDARPAAVRRWAAQRLAQWKEGALPTAIDCPVQVIGVGDALWLATYGGELCSPHADHLQAALSADHVFAMGYSNGGIGYLPTDQMLSEGGYEAVDSVFYSANLAAPFAPGIDQRLVDAARGLADNGWR